jgi:hypothetical protein
MIFIISGCQFSNNPPSEKESRNQLAKLERKWLDAYVEHNKAFMDSVVADGFVITFPGGRQQTKDDILGSLKPGTEPASGPRHHTEDRVITLRGNTAILRGIYVYPVADTTREDIRRHYTDTWMYLDGRWQVVASQLSVLR